MACMTQERKNQLTPAIKAVFKKFGVKGSISVDNHSTLVVTISEAPFDIIQNHIDTTKVNGLCGYNSKPTYFSVNPYYLQHFSGKSAEFLNELKDAMMVGNHNDSDIQSDYFDVGWYIDIKIGRWNKPFICTTTE